MIFVEHQFCADPITLDNYAPNQILFLDIETTGFSPNTSYLYLIGCCYYNKGEYHFNQWFSENPTEEREVILVFFEKMKQFQALVHFNGSTFDLPYIQTKCKQLNINESFDHIDSIDLYRIVSKLKNILGLTSCKQKSVEALLGINREDRYSGGDLIQVYANYCGRKKIEELKRSSLASTNTSSFTFDTHHSTDGTTKELLHLLLLHNAEDVKGLLPITTFYMYKSFFQGSFTISSIELTDTGHLCFQLTLPQAFPAAFKLEEETFHLIGQDSTCTLFIPLFEGSLNLYLEPAKDYYYLPLEDTVIHKSIAASVDKEYRRKATADQCYLKKTGLFLPQTTPLIQPAFRKERKSKISYFECTEERLSDYELLHSYITTLISPFQKKL